MGIFEQEEERIFQLPDFGPARRAFSKAMCFVDRAMPSGRVDRFIYLLLRALPLCLSPAQADEVEGYSGRRSFPYLGHFASLR